MLPYLLAVIIDEPAATVPPPLPASAQAQPPHFHLTPPPADCDRSADAGEIVVCANEGDRKYRLQQVDPDRYADAPIRAETKVGGGTLGLTASTVTVGGIPSNRVMLTFKIKF